MGKYSKELIFDYVCCNDIVGYDIDLLEDDYEFMIDVIDYTKDKSMYNLCSDKIKLNYEFVKFMINKFKDDLKFICKVADYYLSNVKEGQDRIELALIMHNLVKNKDADDYFNYIIVAEAEYSIRRIELEALKSELSYDQTIMNEFGMGFFQIIDEFGSNDIILNFYARNFIDDIFIDNNINLEKMIHEDFEKFEELEVNGINNYLLDFLGLYDCYLANYVSSHIEILDSLKKKIGKFKLRWEHYNYRKELELYDNLLEAVHKYMDKYEMECSFNEFEILYCLGNELGILDKILQYDSFYNDVYNRMSNEYYLDKNEMNFRDLVHYNNLRKLMVNVLNNKDANELFEKLENQVKMNAKILKVNFNG